MKSPLKLYERPRLRNPYLIIGWSDAGQVGTGVIDYLVNKLGAEEFGEIEPQKFSLSPNTLVKGGVLEEIEYPGTSFHYWKNKNSTSDLIIFGSQSPSQGQYEFVNLILDVAELFSVKRIYAVGGVPANIAHDENPNLFAVVNSARVKRYLKPYDVDIGMDYYGPTSMNGLILGLAKQRNIEAISLLGWIPCYITEIPNPRVCEAILRILTRMLSIDIDFSEIESEVLYADKQINEIVSYIREQNPDFFRHIGSLEKGIRFETTEEDRKKFFREIEEFLRNQHSG